MKDYRIFEGTPGVLFQHLEEGNTKPLRELEIIQDYGAYATHAETGEEIPLFQWEGGGRKLARDPQDGAYYLIQTSEIYEFEEANITRDWFQLDSAEQAEWLNTHLTGQQLSYQYDGPHIWTSDEGLRFRKQKEEKSGREQKDFDPLA